MNSPIFLRNQKPAKELQDTSLVTPQFSVGGGGGHNPQPKARMRRRILNSSGFFSILEEKE